MKDHKSEVTKKSEKFEWTEEMIRWEEDGGQNIGCDYEWLSTTVGDGHKFETTATTNSSNQQA